MLKLIERATGSKIAMEKVPTVADLQARRLELTRAALHEALIEDRLDGFRGVVETLTDEYDVMDVAAAAVKLLHESSAGAAEDEAESGRPTGRPTTGPDRKRQLAGPTTRLFIGLGRAAGVRPQDLVGAITGESSLSGKQIGAIEITDRFSLVEIPEQAAEEVIRALRSTMIKGRKAQVRRDAKS